MAKTKLAMSTLLGLLFFSCKEQLIEPLVPVTEFQLEPGFEITCIASEPLIDSPVAIDFDEKGRIWVVEMCGYMRDVTALNENAPTGRISILEDRDEDGTMDSKTVFLDSLVMPRALALVAGGLLYCEPPNLFFIEIRQDTPGKKQLIDPDYAPGLNPEYMANGLLKHRDGWIYSAGAEKKYRYVAGKWETAAMPRKGQWGICQDDLGRLYYNNNAILLMGDYFPPLLPSPPLGSNQVLTQDQRIWPSHPTLVNRGYKPGELDSLGRVKHATSACGPLIYLGHSFPVAYRGNAFVCAPEGNLVKRLILREDEQGWVKAGHAKIGSEFLTSNVATFRPVNLKTGPDGCLYVVDMRRGLIQHQAYLSQYLKQATQEKGLDKDVGMGRIYKISYKGKAITPKHPKPNNDVLAIQRFLNWDSGKAPIDKIKFDFQNWLNRPECSKFEKRQAIAVYGQLKFLSKEDQLAGAFALLQELDSDSISSEFLLYSFNNDRETLAEYLFKNKIKAPFLADLVLQEADKSMESEKVGLFANTDERTAGLHLYRTYCAGCHGLDGRGTANLAPPLVGSMVVNGPKDQLEHVIWNGKNSPVMVRGKLEHYKEPMAAFKENPSWNRQTLEAVVAYVRNAFAKPD